MWLSATRQPRPLTRPSATLIVGESEFGEVRDLDSSGSISFFLPLFLSLWKLWILWKSDELF